MPAKKSGDGQIIRAGGVFYDLQHIQTVKPQSENRLVLTYTNGDAETLAGMAAAEFRTSYAEAHGFSPKELSN